MKRQILFPWLLSAVVMFGISYVWHGLALSDISELRTDMPTYLGLTGLAYLLIGLGLVLMVRFCISREWVSLKSGFPLMSMVVGLAAGLVVYMIMFACGMSFASHGLQHVLVDALWQMFEQAIGGLMVSLGIIYDMHRSFMEAERAR